jgi:hypothetical protein
MFMVPTVGETQVGEGVEDVLVSGAEEKDKALVRRFCEAVTKGDLGALDACSPLGLSIIARSMAKSPAARATSVRSPSNTLPSLTFAPSSRTR